MEARFRFFVTPCDECLKLAICRSQNEIRCDDVIKYLGSNPRIKGCNLIGVLNCTSLWWSNPAFPDISHVIRLERSPTYVRDLRLQELSKVTFRPMKFKVYFKFWYYKWLIKFFNLIRYLRNI
jgi:hypothetical protein